MAPLILPAPIFTKEPFFGHTDLIYSSPIPSPEPENPMERSIRAVMAMYGADDLHGAALLPSYRCIRRRRPQEENQAIAVTHDDNTYKIMLDVRDFAEGTLAVRAVGDNELVVEGVVEKKQESSDSSQQCKSMQSSSKNFQQRFMFPGLQVEGVASSVSSDGVLTITAPRKVSGEKNVEFNMPITATSDKKCLMNNQSSTSSTKKTSVDIQSSQKISTENLSSVINDSQQALLGKQVMKDDTKSNTSQTVATNTRSEHIVPIQVEGNSSTNTGLQSIHQHTTQEKNEKTTQVFKETDKQLSSQDKVVSQSNSIRNVPISTNRLDGASSLFGNLFKDSLVPIDNRGLFFQDSFFENSRLHFQDAINKVMRRVEPNIATPDPFNWYTNLRTADRLEDTRAGTITTEGNNYKIVLDVRDFEEGSVSIRAVGESEILVQGKMDKKSEGSTIMRSFRRRFVMPGHVKCEAITSALSADGVLTITAPKDESHFKLVELKGDNRTFTNDSLDNSSVFGSTTPSCASPSVSIPQSSVTSPISEISGPFEPVFSNTNKPNQFHDISNASSTDTVTNINKSISTESDLQSKFAECMNESSKLISDQKDHSVPIQLQTDLNTNEKIVNINYINKTQKDIEIDLNRTQVETPQYQLIGSVKDLTDSNLKETVKQRKSVISNAYANQNRDIAINYENPSGFSFPIVRRGPFYQDSFFNEVHSNFQSAVRQVLDKWVDVPSLLSRNTDATSFHNFDRLHNTLSNYSSILDRDSFDDFTCYKSLRSRSVKEENQVATVRENAQEFKLVLDVHGFTEKDLVIRATSHNELVIEGNVQEKSPGTVSSRKFKKQFILPGPVRMEAVYSALSADDILTITVPKNKALRITEKE